MAELVDVQDLGSCGAIRVGSTPTTRTRRKAPVETKLVSDRCFFTVMVGRKGRQTRSAAWGFWGWWVRSWQACFVRPAGEYTVSSHRRGSLDAGNRQFPVCSVDADRRITSHLAERRYLLCPAQLLLGDGQDDESGPRTSHALL